MFFYVSKIVLLVYMLQEWFKPLDKNQLLMICSDDMMFDFYIDNADCLIHYDIPVNKETFSIRFSVLQDSQNLFMVSPSIYSNRK